MTTEQMDELVGQLQAALQKATAIGIDHGLRVTVDFETPRPAGQMFELLRELIYELK